MIKELPLSLTVDICAWVHFFKVLEPSLTKDRRHFAGIQCFIPGIYGLRLKNPSPIDM